MRTDWRIEEHSAMFMQLRNAWGYQEDVAESLSEGPVVDQENRVRCILEVNNNVWILSELEPGEPHKESPC